MKVSYLETPDIQRVSKAYILHAWTDQCVSGACCLDGGIFFIGRLRLNSSSPLHRLSQAASDVVQGQGNRCWGQSDKRNTARSSLDS